MWMKKQMKSLAYAILAGGAALALPAQAEFTISVVQSGADVIATGSGSINTAGLTMAGGATCGNKGGVSASRATLCFTNNGGSQHTGITGPTSFGTGAFVAGTTLTGAALDISNSSSVTLPVGYVSGTPMSATVTWTGNTITSLGLKSGTYTWTWGTGADADRIVLNIENTAPLSPVGGVQRGDGSLRMQWTAPDDGGSPITGYTVTATAQAPATGGGSCTAAANATSCDVSGLTNGVTYAVSVRASNAMGDSPESPVINVAPGKLDPGQPLSLPNGSGTASVVIGGGQPGCSLNSLAIVGGAGIPSGAPAGASFPAGALNFRTANCQDDTLSVSITYSNPLPANVQLQKYGPASSGAQPSWFPAPNATLSPDRKTVTYTVKDNGPGDNNPTTGQIDDPFAPMLLAAPPAPGGAQGIPTLSDWGLIFMSSILAMLGISRMRRRQR
ncbi:IPTL-CTERM sorting domain-containing protein [Delftia acidovorans]|nr:IPTL-CTERM sorting domain-containing protein [Delftia acidovorans]